MVEIICPNCNFSKDIPREKIPPGVKWANCPRCKDRFEWDPQKFDLDPGATEDEARLGSERKGGGTPWEDRGELGIWQGIIQTFKAVLFSPENFFKGMPTHRGIGEPLAFGLLCGSLGTMVSLFWQFLMMWGTLLTVGEKFFGLISMNFLFLGILVLTPFFVMINMFVTGGVLHTCLRIARGGKNGFGGTFRVIAYAQTTQILGVIPFVGGLAGWVWRLIVLIIGLREIHETSFVRVVIALLLPIALIFVAVMSALISFFIFF